MTSSFKMGDGLLLLGSTPLNVTAQMRACSVVPKEEVKSTDAIPLLDNTEIPEEEEALIKFTLSGKLLQDLAAAGVIDWSWDHDGNTEEPFIFVPHNPALRGVEGVCYPTPIVIGGDVNKPRTRPESDFEWRCKGTPIFGVFDPGGAGHADDDVDEDA